MKIQAENKAHTPCYPVIAAVAAAMLTLPACAEQTQAPQRLKGKPKPNVESKENGREQRSQQPVMGSVLPPLPPAKPERPPQQLRGRVIVRDKPVRSPQGVIGKTKVAPPKQ